MVRWRLPVCCRRASQPVRCSKGVKFGGVIETDTVVMRSVTGTVRRVHGEHRDFSKISSRMTRVQVTPVPAPLPVLFYLRRLASWPYKIPGII